MIVIDVGSQTIKTQQNAKRPVMIPCAAAQTDELLVGKDAAKELSTRHPNSIQHISASLQSKKLIKLTHPRGETECSLEVLLALLFDKAVGGQKPITENVLVTIPSALTSMELQRIKTAAAGVGVTKLTLLPCVLSIANYFQRKVVKDRITSSQFCLVIDAGCRFTSTAVVKLHPDTSPEIISCKAVRMGGHDVDTMFLQSLNVPSSVEGHPVLFQNAIEKTKKELSSLSESSFTIKSFNAKVTREQFVSAIEPYLKKVTEMVTSVCAAISDPTELTHFVISGGTGRIPALRQIGVTGGSCGLDLQTLVVDYDYCSTQGGVEWVNHYGGRDETVELKEHGGTPFKYWTFDKQNNTVNRLFSTNTTDSIAGDLDVYQQLDDVVSPTVPSPDTFHRISNTENDHTASIDPGKDGTIADCFDDMVQVPSNSHMKGDHKLLCCGTPISLSGLISSPKRKDLENLQQSLKEIYATKAALNSYRDCRNALEEAQFNFEDSDKPIMPNVEGFSEMMTLSSQFMTMDSMSVVDDMTTLTEVINGVVSHFDTNEGEPLPPKLKSSIDTLFAKYFEKTPEPPVTPLEHENDEEVLEVPPPTEQVQTGWMATVRGYVTWLKSFVW